MPLASSLYPVGGGTAGCVLANRLSQDPTISVLLVERGRAANGFISRIPLLSSDFRSDGSRSHEGIHASKVARQPKNPDGWGEISWREF